MSSITVTSKTISSKITIKGTEAINENIKYPHFECNNQSQKDVYVALNNFYSTVAAKYSSYARHALTKKIMRKTSTLHLPVNLSMNYLTVDFGENHISVVIDLCFSEDGKIRMRRFSQIWDISKGRLMRAAQIFNLTSENKKHIFNYILTEAEKYAVNCKDIYEGTSAKVKAHFCFNNFFLTPDGVSFFFDAGILRPEKYGPSCFVMPFSELCDIFKPLSAKNASENDGDL